MDLHLKDKVALVTGSSRGIGRAIAEALFHEGCSVALNARNPESLQHAAEEIGDGTTFFPADVTDPHACRALIDAVVTRHGGIDILVCNVGSGSSVPPGCENSEEWDRVFRLNFWSATNMIEAAKEALSQRSGTIVCISSICGCEVLGAPVTYSSAKAALNAYIRGIARPLAVRGIRINGIAPGNILFPDSVWERRLKESPGEVEAMLNREVALNRLGRPEEIADMCVFLASPRSAFCTGALYVMDGGHLRS